MPALSLSRGRSVAPMFVLLLQPAYYRGKHLPMHWKVAAEPIMKSPPKGEHAPHTLAYRAPVQCLIQESLNAMLSR
eukprot:1161437-Pelagomonas_calceolata.AAC.4